MFQMKFIAVVAGVALSAGCSTSTAVQPTTLRSGALQPALGDALAEARTAAAADGVEIVVNSGWRSKAHQARLFKQAVKTYGSAAEAARWVARPGTSVHEAGEAIDIGPETAASWLSIHGSRYGLCQTYVNERWHYELRSEARAHGCPAMYEDPTHDPRLGGRS